MSEFCFEFNIELIYILEREECIMRSDAVKKGIERAPHRALFKAMAIQMKNWKDRL